MSELSMSIVRMTAARQVREWGTLLGDKTQPPLYSREEQKRAWITGYNDALTDLATLRATGEHV